MWGKAATTGMLVVDLLFEQQDWFAEQFAEHSANEAVANECAEHVVVLDEVFAPGQDRAGVGLFEVVQARAIGVSPPRHIAHRSVDRGDFARFDRPAHHEPTLFAKCRHVDLHVFPHPSSRPSSSATNGAQSSADG